MLVQTRETFLVVKRTRRKQTISFGDRLKMAAKEARQAAQQLPHGREREDLLRKARQAEAAIHINGWLTSPGQPPR